jgi:hypothetical protein
MNKIYFIVIGIFLSSVSLAQDVEETFNGTRILNGHSIETLEKNNLQVRIEHRFGNFIGSEGGVNSFFGFDEAADIRLGFEYGILDNLMVGIGRCKGTGAPYSSLLDGFVKYRFLTQNTEKGIPFSVAAFASTTLTYQKAVEDISVVQNFPEFQHRLAYCTQIHIARKFGERFSIALVPSYVHRNLVLSNDINGMFALGGAFSVNIIKGLGIVGEYYQTFHPEGTRPDNFNSLSGGIEWVKGGHNFKLVLTNSKGFDETQFIPYTFSDWQKNQFRIGFSITRNFQL